MAFSGTYLKIFEFTAVYFQSDLAGVITETKFPWANALKPAYEQQTFEWAGDAQKKKISILIAVNWTLDLDVIPLAAHRTVFGKAEITAAPAVFDKTTMVGFGGGNDGAGVTRGLRAVANAYAGDLETPVEVNIWAPITTITLAQIGGLSTSTIGDKTQYNISAKKTAIDIAGAAIAGASAGGEFFYIAESA